jgi:6-phosphofructokinase 1
MLFVDPARIACGVLTCGGLCPGVNNVIRSIVLSLTHEYGVRRILGFRYGFAGLADPEADPPLELDDLAVKNIHEQGGTVLGTSRGPRDLGQMVDNLERFGIRVLFVIGGDGTMRGAHALVEEIAARDASIAVVAIPKTIDNDLMWIERCFGFATAVEEAERAIDAAHAEARSANSGVGLVKLMGRYAGFIAAHASLSNSDVNYCLVPEVRFALEGERGLLAHLENRLNERRHAVIVVAEGAGQDLFGDAPTETDASGNPRLHDIGALLQREIQTHFEERGRKVTLKYIDPSYMIRGIPANSIDSELCLVLGQHAVHAGLSGRTDMMVSRWNRQYVHVPIRLATEARRLDPDGETWRRVLEATGQPAALFE